MNDSRIDLGKYCVISIWFGCNNDCAICMLSNVKSSLPVISFDRYRKVLVDIMQDGRFKNLILSGAEVTTFDALDKYITCAADLGWFKKIQIQTNGRRLSDRRYLEHLIHCGVTEFFVSIHGFDQTHDNATCVPGAFKETLEGLRNLSRCDANVITNTVLTKRNLPEITRFITFLCGESVSELHLWNYFPMEKTDSGDLIVSLTDLLQVLPGLQSIMTEAGKVLVMKSFPLCLPAGPPVFLDSVFPVTVLPDLFWQEFNKCGFGKCAYRETGACSNVQCWGLSSAYLQKYGDEQSLLKPIKGLCTPKAAMRKKKYSEPEAAINRRGETMHPIEYTSAGDVFYDFCMWEYKPAVPFIEKFKSVNLLFHSFDVTGVNPRIHDLVRAIREGIGSSRTVWGVKQLGRNIQWEFYFYDYKRRNRELSMSRLLEVIRPFITCNVKVNENFQYFMFSIDISGDLISGTGDLEEIHMYVGNPGSTVSSGICYSLTPKAVKLENFYFFFDAKTQANEIRAKALSSAYIDSRINLDWILWPEMWNSKVIVVANKQQNDAVYFSGINVDQLILFLKRMRYPLELVSYIEKNRQALDHLQYDAGYDYRLEGNELLILKSGYYGIF